MQTTLDTDLMIRSWEWLSAEPAFDGIPYRFEVKPNGQIIMSPTKNFHGRLQFVVASLLQQHGPAGKAFVELSTKTPDGMYEVDSAWSLDGARLLKQDYADPAAEICVEVRSPSNTHSEFQEKRKAYFEAGAKEVWFVDGEGNVSFYSPGVSLIHSLIMPNFPSKIEL